MQIQPYTLSNGDIRLLDLEGNRALCINPNSWDTGYFWDQDISDERRYLNYWGNFDRRVPKIDIEEEVFMDAYIGIKQYHIALTNHILSLRNKSLNDSPRVIKLRESSQQSIDRLLGVIMQKGVRTKDFERIVNLSKV